MLVLDLLREAMGQEPTDTSALPERFSYGEDAPAALAEELRTHADGRRAVLLADVRTREVAAGEVMHALKGAGWEATELVIPDRAAGPDPSPICDDLTHDAMAARLPACDAVIAVGSGVVNDLSKWLAADAGVPYGVYGTAASMNGYAAANVAATMAGLKTLVAARAPRVVAAHPRVLGEAPHRLTAAGLGDVIAKPVSTADWLVNHLLFDERFRPEIARIIDQLEPSYLNHPEGLASGKGDAMRALFFALVLSGCAMTLHGSSMPASGGEHLISHTLDMTSEALHLPHDLHGRQVGVATIFAAALYQQLFDLEQPRFDRLEVPFDASVWGRIAPEVEREHGRKRERVAEASRLLSHPEQVASLHARVRPQLRSPEAIKRCLRAAGAAHTLDDIGCSRERFLMAVDNASSMRARFTSLDLARCAGVLPEQAEALVDEWLS